MIVDRNEFVHVYDAYAQQVLFFITKRVLDAELAFDLMSEVFAVAFERCEQFRGDSQAQDVGWLLAIARNEMNGFWRRGRTERRAVERLHIQRVSLEDASLERIEEASELHALGPVVLAALDALPPDQRETVRMRVIDELDYDEIATALDVSRDVVRSRVSRGLRTIARELDDDTVEDVA